MFSKILSSGQPQLLKKALDVYQKQHEAISKNVANASNDNYKRINTDFTSELQNAQTSNSQLKTTNSKHISSNDNSPSLLNEKKEGNTVDITREMGLLAENQIKYEFATRALSRMYKGISNSITGKTR
ncbi:MAG: flagellar basal body rod protein FlgB [Candidatus Marinimicrobia bacterium]|nr:flagellar basal body rod protein FlgB [Candidatus Neomarinimicrobiota bacterium]|tara:strand:- start:170 stop:553 length:384 start_codon:yes stop_codon:yes gene_type:complete